MSIVSRVDHVLTMETSGNRLAAVSWPILLLVYMYMLINFVSISILPRCVMISTNAIAALQINGVDRKYFFNVIL